MNFVPDKIWICLDVSKLSLIDAENVLRDVVVITDGYELEGRKSLECREVEE